MKNFLTYSIVTIALLLIFDVIIVWQHKILLEDASAVKELLKTHIK